MLGFPTVLVYLGFIGDRDIQDVGAAFADEMDWQRAFAAYIDRTFPLDLFDRRLDLGPAPVWLLARSRAVIGAPSGVVS